MSNLLRHMYSLSRLWLFLPVKYKRNIIKTKAEYSLDLYKIHYVKFKLSHIRQTALMSEAPGHVLWPTDSTTACYGQT